MPAFSWQALDAAGRTSRGVLQADTPRAARAALRERGLTPLDVQAVADEAAGGALPRLGRRLSTPQLALLTRQLATLVRSGLPLDEALAALVDGSEGLARTQVLAVRARVMEGAALAEAMAAFPRSFPPAFRAAVSAGEQSGRLDVVLERLADWAEARDALRRQLWGALAYPLLLCVVALGVVVALMSYVVPQVVGVFVQGGQVLPLPTRVLIGASDLLRVLWLPLLVAVVVLSGAAMTALRRPALRARLQSVLLRLPVLGRWLRADATAHFARTLALLTGSAVPLLDALAIASGVVPLAPMRAALERVAQRVREGQSFARALEESRAVPPVAVRLVASGERAGRLDAMLDEAAAQSERELATALSVVSAALGPAVILGVGALVLFIVLAILLPIFELNTLVR